MRSVRSRRNESSISFRTRLALASRNTCPSRQFSPTLVAINTLSRRPSDSAGPTISSARPKPYAGAVSIRVMPRSSAAWIVAIDCCSSVPPHIHPPIAHVPKAMRDDLIPVPAISICSIMKLLIR
jgi:hypothetical protein